MASKYDPIEIAGFYSVVEVGGPVSAFYMPIDTGGLYQTIEVPGLNAAIVAEPVYDGVPLIAAGSEPWPGGTVTMTPATVAGADSEVYDWLLDDVSTGTDSLTYTPAAGSVGSALKPQQTATNGAGSATVTGSAVTIEHLSGITRADETGSDWPRIASQGEVPSAGTILVECITTALDALGGFGVLAAWMDARTQPNRRGIVLRIDALGALNVLIYQAANTPGITYASGITWSGALDGTTRAVIGVSWTVGGSCDVFLIERDGTVTSEQVTASTPAGIAYATASVEVDVFEHAVQGSAGNQGLQGTAEACGLSRAISGAERSAIAAADCVLRDWGAYSDGSLAWALYPASTEEDGDSITTSAQLAGATWAITSGTARLTAGGLNGPTT